MVWSRIKRAIILDDPFDDPAGLAELIPDKSPELKPPAEVMTFYFVFISESRRYYYYVSYLCVQNLKENYVLFCACLFLNVVNMTCRGRRYDWKTIGFRWMRPWTQRRLKNPFARRKPSHEQLF